jgi:hypothetical protein
MVGGSGEEETAERVRNPEGGTYPVRQAGAEWTRLNSSVLGEETSGEVPGAKASPRRVSWVYTLERAQPQE